MIHKFSKLPSGIVINTDRIEYFCGVNAIRRKGAHKPSEYTFAIQYIDRAEPITLSYDNIDAAKSDYDYLAKSCTFEC